MCYAELAFPSRPPSHNLMPVAGLGAHLMRTSLPIASIVCAIALLGVSTAHAQYAPVQSDPRSVGERYHVEFGFYFWDPSPIGTFASESLGIPGTEVDLVTDFGVTKRRFRQMQVFLRPAKKHKFRMVYTPIRYSADATLTRDLVFNGILFPISVPVSLDFQWNAWQFGYEYDFVYRERGFVGIIVEAKYTDVQVSLDSIIGNEFARARAPVPAIGGIGRVYVTSSTAITFEVTGIQVPNSLAEDVDAKYIEYNLYGTFNFTNNVGVRVGYRNMDVDYRVDLDSGDFQLKGFYFGGVARF